MDETEFWELIDAARQGADGDPEDQADLLVERLLDMDPDLVLDFARHFEARYNRACTWDLWGAAWLLLGGASDDAFDYFRCWLIGQGREVYEGAVHEPDSLAELLDDFDEELDGDGEELGYAADEAYEQLTGTVAPDLGIAPAPAEPLGTPIDPDKDVAVLYVPGLRAPVLRFDEDASRGDAAVVAGYPQNGDLDLRAATVANRVRATGQNIYNDENVTREIYSIRSTVRPGNSGGPLLTTDGRVYGVVFARSTSDAETGYVLTAAEVAPDARAAADATRAVDTGEPVTS
ncbi:hypothetical protein STENM327S_01349 [Streptomyces tendae]